MSFQCRGSEAALAEASKLEESHGLSAAFTAGVFFFIEGIDEFFLAVGGGGLFLARRAGEGFGIGRG
jgi:hypothetical protein